MTTARAVGRRPAPRRQTLLDGKYEAPLELEPEFVPMFGQFPLFGAVCGAVVLGVVVLGVVVVLPCAA